MITVLPVLGEAAATIEPGDSTFDNPASGQDFEAYGLIGSLYYLDRQVGKKRGNSFVQARPLIAAVGEEFAQKRIQTKQTFHDQNAAVKVLDVGGVNHGVQ